MKKPLPAAAAAKTVALSPGLKRYLYLTAAITGASIMIVEILGAKMLAPYVGTSHFVWTAQIAVTLVALATGYYTGGRLVDRSPKLRRLYLGIMGAAIYLGFSVLAVRPVAYWCLDFKLAIGSLLASAFLFFIPLALLAMVGPFFVRILTVSVAGVGGNVGRLTALSTLGSFFGTVLIGYVLIPFFPNSWTMLLTAFILAAVAAVYFAAWDRRGGVKRALAGVLFVGLLAYVGIRVDGRKAAGDLVERFRGNSNFGLVQVMDNEEGDRRYYLNDFLTQNIYDPQARQSVTLFTYMLHDLARAYTPRVETALCIGMGMGIVPTQLAREGVAVDVVEINPAVVSVAEKYFDCEPGRFRVEIGDGRQFINRATNRYDTILLDAFLGDSSPSHLMTREAFDSMRHLLKPGGTLVINAFVDLRPGNDFFGASLEKTLQTVFKNVRLHASATDDLANVFYVASDQADFSMTAPAGFDHVSTVCRERAVRTFQNVVHAIPENGLVLTDDYNPVDFRDAANRETTRRRMAERMRSL